MSMLDLTQLDLTSKSKLKNYRAGLASFAAQNGLSYASSENSLPDDLSEVTATTYYGKCYRAVCDMLNKLGLGTVDYCLSPAEQNGYENYTISSVTEDVLNSNKEMLYDLCKTADITPDRTMATVENLGNILYRFTNPNGTNSHFQSASTAIQGMRNLSSVYPASVMSDATYSGSTGLTAGKEMFGAGIQQKVVDIKTALTITLVKGHKGITNRVMHRVANDTGWVMFIVPNDEFYDLAKSQSKLAAERDSFTHRRQVLQLLTHPEPVDMELIPVHLDKKVDDAFVANGGSTGRKPWLLANDVILPGVEMNLWDLCMIEGKVGFDQLNYTDLLSGKITLRAVHVEIEDAAGTKEQFILNVAPYSNMTVFEHRGNTVNNQADRVCSFHARLPFDKDTIKADNTRTNIFQGMNRGTEYVIAILDFSARTNTQSTKTIGQGSIGFIPAVSIEGTPASGSLIDLVKDLKATIIGWEIDAFYSEQNFRKTNMAVRALSDVFTYALPDGRTIVADYSHQQTLAEHALQVAAEVQTIGIDHRNMQIFMKTLKATHDRIRNERVDKRYIENFDNQTVSKSFVSGRRVNPTVAIKTIDMSKVVNFQSSDMLSDNWTYMRACLNAILTEINYRSLLPQALEDKPIKYKVITTTPLLDCIFSLASIHANQMPSGINGEQVFDAKTPGKPVEFKTKLPNGVELEFVTTVFHYMKDQMVFLPYRENAPMDDLNFGINLDGGQYSVNWCPTDGANMTIRREMLNTREYPIPTCGIGAIIEVKNYDHLTKNMFDI